MSDPQVLKKDTKMGWFDTIERPGIKTAKKPSSLTPTGLWKKCASCSEILQTSRLDENLGVCPYCEQHFRISAMERIEQLIDPDTFIEMGSGLMTTDPLVFVDKKAYSDRLEENAKNSGLLDSCLMGLASMGGKQVSLAVMDFRFMGGSMGVVTGEKIAMAMDEGHRRSIPVIVVSCSGGARMQEGILSLMQMAKTSAARQRLKEARVPFISILTDPTTGGCAASFAMQGDVNLAEPGALIGFAGPRVIEQSIRERLPDGFQRSEFLLEHGFIDRIVHRKKLRDEILFFIDTFSTTLPIGTFPQEAK